LYQYWKTHEVKEFLDWFSNTPFTHKVFIAGNHDWGFEKNHDIAPDYKEKGVHYLFDSMVELDGVKIYGSPWQPEFYDWAFNLPRGEKLAEKWSKIPEGLDILVTHGPAHGMVDHTMQGLNVGCKIYLIEFWKLNQKSMFVVISIGLMVKKHFMVLSF
jgi:hypothetical protein